MLAPSDFQTATIQMVPIIAFTIGLAGSLHCVGMCGPLALSFGQTKFKLWTYQIGRLLGYLFIGLIVGLFGTKIGSLLPPWTAHLAGLFLGFFFLYLGLKIWTKKENPMPKFLENKLTKLWAKYIPSRPQTGLLVGMLSIFLPCGLLYGVFLGLLSLQNPKSAILALFFFWLGTLPAMIMGPSLSHKFLAPLAQKFPFALGPLLATMGFSTIIYRAWGVVDATCH